MALRTYYERDFPYDDLERYVTCNGKYPLCRREFAFRSSGDVFRRYETFSTPEEARAMGYMEREEVPLHAKVPIRFGNMDIFKRYLVRTVPKSIEAGPVYDSIFTQAYDRRDPYTIKPCPITFDIDIKDYDDVRPCDCREKRLCDVCWVACMRPALVDLVAFLTDHMQFERVVPLFSGRCGVHVIVADERVWTWDDGARAALVTYLPRSVRVDKGVMRTDHLVKIPFSPHAVTGRLALPILDMHTFLPSSTDVGDLEIYLAEWRRKILS